jgi:hypothetical protein
MLVARLVAGRIDSALMQCSLGSRSGTSGDDVCGASRSWTGDAIPLAWRVQGAATGVCRPHHTGHQSFFASQLEERPRPHRLAWLRNPSSVSLLRSNWLPHLGNRLIISNMTKSNAPKNSRKAANNSTALGRYKQASLLPSVKRLPLLGQLVLTEILMRNLQASQWTGTRNPTKKAPDGHAKCH